MHCFCYHYKMLQIFLLTPMCSLTHSSATSSYNMTLSAAACFPLTVHILQMVIPVLLWSDLHQHQCHHTITPFSMWLTTLHSFQTVPGATLHRQFIVAWLTLLLGIIQVLSSSLYIFVMLNEYLRNSISPQMSLFCVPS
jgi:hypothetical protein